MICNAHARSRIRDLSIDQPDLDGSVLRALLIEANFESHARDRHQIRPCAVAKVRYVHEQILLVGIVRRMNPQPFSALYDTTVPVRISASNILRAEIAACCSGAAGALSAVNSSRTRNSWIGHLLSRLGEADAVLLTCLLGAVVRHDGDERERMSATS